MLDRDERILKHIGLYRVSLRGVIEELFFAGESCDHVIERLLADGRIKVIKHGLPDNLSYYQLVERELRARGMPKHRADPRGDRLEEDLAVLWFSCMGPKPRPRIERNPLKQVFGRGPGMGSPHCREKVSADQQVVYRIRLAGPETDDGRLLRDIEFGIESGLTHPLLAPYILEKLYGFTILVDNPDRVERLSRLLKERKQLGALIQIEEVPGKLRLAAALRERRSEKAQQ